MFDLYVLCPINETSLFLNLLTATNLGVSCMGWWHPFKVEGSRLQCPRRNWTRSHGWRTLTINKKDVYDEKGPIQSTGSTCPTKTLRLKIGRVTESTVTFRYVETTLLNTSTLLSIEDVEYNWANLFFHLTTEVLIFSYLLQCKDFTKNT